MAEQIRVLVLGYGEMGHAIEYLIKSGNQYRQLKKTSECQQEITLQIWDKYPERGFKSVNLEESVPQADLVFFCLPVNPHREIAEQISPLLKKGSICLSIAKGLDEAGQTAAEIFSDVFMSENNPQKFALMYGPMISEEICAGRFAFAQLACSDNESFYKISKLFEGTRFYLEQAYDIPGISWSVILKNVYAMIFGMADELKLGDNMRGYLSFAALRELDQIVRKKGGELGSPYHLAGLGDLITTGTSEDSHHHELGRMLARGEIQNISGEGVHTLEMVRKYQIIDTTDYPLFELTESIVRDPSDVNTSINEYLIKVFN
ncbi:Glycerol-3-phosphate dehydrogenase [NAD(P)+] [Nymphon striatum]|nr:Glycerol-3-phosphate dehydrogenase [NAD(P)+] [Nymphon striatum]